MNLTSTISNILAGIVLILTVLLIILHALTLSLVGWLIVGLALAVILR